MEEDEGQAKGACIPEKGAETANFSGQDKSVHARLAELLRDSEHEESHRGIEQMALPQNPDVYLETLEEAEDENPQPAKAGRSI